MRTSLNELQQIENYLLEKGDPSERLVIEAKMSLSADFNDKVLAQKSAYSLIRNYGRSQLINDIKSVDHQLFNLPKYKSFRSTIFQLFSK